MIIGGCTNDHGAWVDNALEKKTYVPFFVTLYFLHFTILATFDFLHNSICYFNHIYTDICTF